MSRIFFYWLMRAFSLTLASAPLQGISEHIALAEMRPSLVVKYQFVDLGPADLDVKSLSRMDSAVSQASSINNLGHIVFSTSQGSHLRDPAFGEYLLKLNDAKVYAHALNNKGEMLVSVNRSDKQIEWVLWPRRSLFGVAWNEKELNAKKAYIARLDDSGPPLFMSLLNDQSACVGYQKKEQLFPLVWDPKTGLNPMGHQAGLNAAVLPLAINNQGTIGGYYQDANDNLPFVWHPDKGINILRNYRDLVQSHGWVELADLVVTEDNIVYGTYVVKEVSKAKGDEKNVGVYFVYRWDPARDDFNVLGMPDFRIADVNQANTLVGSYKGRAALRRQGSGPMELKEMVPAATQEWELLEATSINDRDQIVGYGTKMGKIHHFLIEPMP